MSTYPSSATLAAFRERYSPDSRGIGDATIGDLSPESGAWPDERQHGIGYRDPDIRTDPWIAGVTLTNNRGRIARRGASAMRSRAYGRSGLCDGCPTVLAFVPHPLAS